MSGNKNSFKEFHDSGMIHEHIKIMSNNKSRSESNLVLLRKHDTKIDELSKVHSALIGLRSEMKHITIKLDDIKTDKEERERQFQLHKEERDAQLLMQQKQLEEQQKERQEFVKLITNASKEIALSNKKTWKDRFEDALAMVGLPLLIMSIVYMIFQALEGGVAW